MSFQATYTVGEGIQVRTQTFLEPCSNKPVLKPVFIFILHFSMNYSKTKSSTLLSLIIKYELYIVKQQMKLKLFFQSLSQLTRTYLPFTVYLKSFYIER